MATIDQQIDANRRQLLSLERVKPHSAESWQAAWDRHPELQARDRELFRQRGIAQLERDERAFAALKAKPIQIPRQKKCPTCGHRTVAP